MDVDTKFDANTSFKIEKQILTDETPVQVFLYFAVENNSELFGYIAAGRVNIKIHRGIEGNIWFGVVYSCNCIF